MPAYTQGEEYAENETAPKPKAKSRRTEEEVEEVEETVEEETPKVSGITMSPKLIACIVGIVALLVLVGCIAVFVGGKKSALKAEQESKALEESMGDLPMPIDDAPVVGGEEDLPVPVDETVAVINPTTYSDKTAATLRKWGYTNSEMEIASRDGLSPEALVEAAKKEREEALWESMQSLMDSTSDDYKNLCNQTWLGQPPLDVSGFTNDVMYVSSDTTVNVDFEKIESRGTQLWVKCYLKDGNTLFLQMSPMRYNQLPDSGNMVVHYTTIQSGDTYVVISAEEVRVES